MFKKTILLATGIFVSNALQSYPEKPLDFNTLPRYTEHYINTLFGTHRDQSHEEREFLTHIRNRTESSAKTSCADYFFIFPTGTFNRECVEHAIRTTSLNVIVEEAHTIAYGYTHVTATLTYINETITNEILRIFSESGNLNGTLRNYLGENLKQKVWQLKNKFDAQKRVAQPNRYPSESCCTCLESFGGAVERVFLEPCGHDICPDCAREWFFTRNNPSCPTCRTDVSKRTLAYKLGYSPAH